MKRTALKAKTPLSVIGKKQPTCPVCEQKYTRTRVGQPVCSSVKCSMEWIKRKEVEKRVAPYRTKPRKPNNTLRHQLELTQRVFNQWIRWRDRHLPCISSGRTESMQWDAGHYRPVGGIGGSILRFNPMNCHKQDCEQNQHQGGAPTEYRVNLIHRIGLDNVEWLESVTGTKKWDIDEVKAIRRQYRRLLRDEQAAADAAD